MAAAIGRSLSERTEAAASEAIGGIVAIVLTILGLAQVAPMLLVAIATIAMGIALAVHGAIIATEYCRLFQRTGEQSIGVAELGGGSAWSTEFLAGGGGIVLGILALLNVHPVELIAIAVIAFGGALILSSSSAAQVNIQKVMRARLDEPAQRLAGGFLAGSAGAQAIAGLAAVTLGILALAGFSPIALVLIALLSLGSFTLLNGSALGGIVLTILQE